MTTILLVCTSGTLMLFLLCLPLLAEKVPPNPFYGVRIPATLSDRRTWYAVNRFAARRLIWAAAATAGLSTVFYFVPGLSPNGYALLCLAAALLSIAGALFLTLRHVRSRGWP